MFMIPFIVSQIPKTAITCKVTKNDANYTKRKTIKIDRQQNFSFSSIHVCYIFIRQCERVLVPFNVEMEESNTLLHGIVNGHVSLSQIDGSHQGWVSSPVRAKVANCFRKPSGSSGCIYIKLITLTLNQRPYGIYL